MAMINGMYVLAESEDPKYEVDVTDQPVEDGIDTSDHVQRKPRAMDVSGYIVGDDAAQIREKLIALADKGEIVQFMGRNLFTGVIQSLSTKHDYKVANGFSFSLSLKEIRIAKSSYVETLPTPIKAAAAPVISSGRKQTKKKGKGDKKEEKKVEKVKFKAGSPWAEE
ncbi:MULTISPECIES: phage baseplate protein [Brevibacillus]|uniref:phage baseplate protein n=1 Tax=Brevibacillus TaxID=55080 RepID=UPI001C8CFD7A|nr:hypothetical protein [Brevibacillus brevis]MBY0085776.1 hypothetical protein [Brevibacillus brevis]